MTKSEYRQELKKKILSEVNTAIRGNEARITLTHNKHKLEMLEIFDSKLRNLKEKIEKILE